MAATTRLQQRVNRATNIGNGLFISVMVSVSPLILSSPAVAGQFTSPQPVATNRLSNIIAIESVPEIDLQTFTQELLATLELISEQVDDPYNKVGLLSAIALAYIGLEQPEAAEMWLALALSTTQNITDSNQKIEALSFFADIYYNYLNDLEKMEQVLTQMTDLVDSDNPDLEDPEAFIAQIALNYARLGQLEKAEEFLDQLEDPYAKRSMQKSFLRFSVVQAMENGEHERARQQILASDLRSSASSKDDPPEVIEQQIMMHQLLELSLLASDYHQKDLPEQHDATIALQAQLIEKIPDPATRAQQYVTLAQQLIGAKKFDSAITFLEQALQILEMVDHPQLEAEQKPSEQNLQPSYQRLRIGQYFIEAGEVERGLSVIRMVDNSPENLIRKVATLSAVSHQLAADESNEQAGSMVRQVLAEAEQLVRSLPDDVERIEKLLNVATTYSLLEEYDRARAINQEIQQFYEQADSTQRKELFADDKEFATQWARLLLTLEEYEQATQMVITSGDTELSTYLPGRLVEAQQSELAWAIVASISSPNSQVYAIRSIAQQYLLLDQLDQAFEAMTKAIDIAQQMAPDSAPSNNREDTLDEEPDLEREQRSIIMSLVQIYSQYADEAQVEQLIQQIDNDEIRGEVSKAMAASTEDLQAIQAMPNSEEKDTALLNFAVEATYVGDIEPAMMAIATIDTPYLQAHGLSTIMYFYQQFPQPVAPEIDRMLQKIQRQYQSN